MHLDIPKQNEVILLSVIGSIIAQINFNKIEKVAKYKIGDNII